MIKLSVSILGQTTGYRIYTLSREPIRLPEIQYLVFDTLVPCSSSCGDGEQARAMNFRRIATSILGLFPNEREGRDKALASAGHVIALHPKLLGVIIQHDLG